MWLFCSDSNDTDFIAAVWFFLRDFKSRAPLRTVKVCLFFSMVMSLSWRKRGLRKIYVLFVRLAVSNFSFLVLSPFYPKGNLKRPLYPTPLKHENRVEFSCARVRRGWYSSIRTITLSASCFSCTPVMAKLHWPSGLTSLEGTLEPFRLVHQVSTVAMRQDSTTPAASTKNTPAKLWMSKALPFFLVPTAEYRSHGLSRGHHFSFRMSISPFCCSSRILETEQGQTHCSYTQQE